MQTERANGGMDGGIGEEYNLTVKELGHVEKAKKSRSKKNYRIHNLCTTRPKNPITTVPKKETILVLPYLGVQSKIITKQLKTSINKFMAVLILG